VTDVAELAKRVEELAVAVGQLQSERDEAKSERDEAKSERDEYHRLYLEMLERNRQLERGLLAPKSERLMPSEQLSLAVLGTLLPGGPPPDEPPEEQEVKTHKRRKPKRKGLPEDLPRHEVTLLPPEVEAEGVDAFEKIGEEVTEVLERRPSSAIVLRFIKPKFVRKDRERGGETQVYVAATPTQPIPRGLAGPGMLADTLVKRWDDHLPLNRLERVYAREGVELARSTMCGWHIALAELCQPLLAAMRRDALEQPYLCTDATGVLVQAKEKCRSGHFWVMVVPGRHVLFEFTKKHTKEAVDEVLGGYEGFIVADAHAVYDHLYRDGPATEVNCWAHARRYFFKAMSSDPDRAQVALRYIGHLFRVERQIADSPRKQREKVRKKQSTHTVRAFFSWCEAEKHNVLDDTPIQKGIQYAINQREGLSRFLTDGRLPIHNNMSELALRRQAVGRKNWLFIGSDDGALANTTFVSLLASCRLHDIEPWSYLRDLFCLLDGWPDHDLLALTPLNWKTTLERDDVQSSLAANPYRDAVLDTQA
jgi:transposase